MLILACVLPSQRNPHTEISASDAHEQENVARAVLSGRFRWHVRPLSCLPGHRPGTVRAQQTAVGNGPASGLALPPGHPRGCRDKPAPSLGLLASGFRPQVLIR